MLNKRKKECSGIHGCRFPLTACMAGDCFGETSRMDIIGQNGNDGDHYDSVNHPAHYTQGAIECIDAIKAQLTPEEFRGYCKGAAAKYIWRERHKGGDESLAKAVWYLNAAIKTRGEVMSHTPGPWKWNNEGYSYLRTATGEDVHDFGCGCCSCTSSLSDANARLIAAAPELLEALELISTATDRGFGIDYAKGCARAAIAKARGQ